MPTDLVEAAQTGPAESTWQRLDLGLAAEVLGRSPSDDLHTKMKQLWEHSGTELSATQSVGGPSGQQHATLVPGR
ncbi:hypothetical protein [Micromonospora sp. NPDC049102]|uniref:hypothetical protein n=1 Tax=Micromonospora sp. NPDC049102 TaxID=3364265 RepID=UPI00370FD52F